MVNKKKNALDGFFQNSPEFFNKFTGILITAKELKSYDFSSLNVAIIGANQHIVTYLEQLCHQAQSIKVFQITPHFILPHTERGIHKLLSHPLIIKNRRLFNNRIKSLLAIRYLESEVKNNWLKRQLMPNSASENKLFFKSDSYYRALQDKNCQLITWPIVKITDHTIYSMDGTEHSVDIIITTY
jgi:cation diffusion facilitator CzcD-associated flavoprotein CzcO